MGLSGLYTKPESSSELDPRSVQDSLSELETPRVPERFLFVFLEGWSWLIPDGLGMKLSGRAKSPETFLELVKSDD